MKINVIPAPEAAYLLRRELGPIRAWDTTLADMRRGRADVYGLTLLPKCQGKFAHAWRPMYAVDQVEAFIEAVRKANPSAARGVPHLVKTAHIDPTDVRPWRARKLLVARSTFAPTAGYLPV